MFPGLSAPLDVEFGITRKCQLQCNYCSAMPLKGDHAPSERAIELVRELGELGVFSLLISGGEPTIHPDFIGLVSVAAKLIPSIAISTNGMRLAKIEFAEGLKRAAPNALVSISLDSPNPQVSDIERGAGGKLAIQAIENCVSVGQVVCISCVLTESGLHEAIALIDKFSPRVRKFKFFPRVPRNKNDLLLNGSSYNKRVAEFYSSLGVLANVRPELDLLTPMPIRLDNALGDRLIGDTKCICTATKLYIDAQLDVYPCYYSASHANRIGSCDNSSISSLWISHKAQELRRLASESRLCGAGFGKNEIPSRYISLDKIRVDDSNGSAPISFK